MQFSVCRLKPDRQAAGRLSRVFRLRRMKTTDGSNNHIKLDFPQQASWKEKALLLCSAIYSDYVATDEYFKSNDLT